MTITPAGFIRIVTGCTTDQTIELRCIRGGHVTAGFYQPDDLDLERDIERSVQFRYNAFFGVAPRVGGAGARANCPVLNSLFVDYDLKLAPEDLMRERLREFGFQPSAIVASGGGYHSYFVLDQPLQLAIEFERARSLLRKLCIKLGGDIAAAEPVRILRAPHSTNFKYAPPRRVEVNQFGPSIRHRAEDLEEALRDVEDTRAARTFEWKETSAPRDPNSTRPGDLLNARASWCDLLEPHGWKAAHKSGAAIYWVRPGKRGGISASTNFDGRDFLWVFSSNAPPFEAGRGYSKFSVFALLEHRGDFAAAARELVAAR